MSCYGGMSWCHVLVSCVPVMVVCPGVMCACDGSMSWCHVRL